MTRSRSSSMATAILFAIALTAVLVVPAAGADGPAAPPVIRGAESLGPVVPHVFEGDLRRLPLAPVWQPGDPVKEIPRRHNGPIGPEPMVFGTPRPTEDPLVERQAEFGFERVPEAFDTPIINIAGQGYTGLNPPDTVGDVGRDYYVQAINGGGGTSVVIYDKVTGAIASGPFTLDNLGSGNCGSGLGDPVVLYDELASRWFLTEFSIFGNRLCVYVSRTSSPITGGWYNYEFQATNFPDYPKYAVWPDAYYVASNENSPAAYALEREQMLDGLPADFQRFTAPPLSGFGFQALTPSDVDGPAPPAGTPGWFIRHKDDEVHSGGTDPTQDFLELFAFQVDWANPGNSSFTGPIQVGISEIDSNMCGLFSFSCFDQPGGADLDPLREVVMWRSQYRNFGSYEVLVGNLVTDAGVDQGAVRWFELRNEGSQWFLYQEGTYSPNNDNRWMGSAAMDVDGNLAVGYNVSSTQTFPALRYVGRLSTDPLGVMTTGEASLVEGSGSNSSNRYGDYSSLNVDPVNGCTYWFTGEYNTSSNWSTRVGAFAFDTCEVEGPTFVIASIDPCLAGATNTWNVAGATPFADVEVRCNPVGSPNQLVVGVAAADGNGDAAVSRFVPGGASGRSIECFAEDLSNGAMTPLVVKSFP